MEAKKILHLIGGSLTKQKKNILGVIEIEKKSKKIIKSGNEKWIFREITLFYIINKIMQNNGEKGESVDFYGFSLFLFRSIFNFMLSM